MPDTYAEGYQDHLIPRGSQGIDTSFAPHFQGPIHDVPNDKFAAKSEQFCFTHNISLKDGILAICLRICSF